MDMVMYYLDILDVQITGRGPYAFIDFTDERMPDCSKCGCRLHMLEVR